jgi:hypothetical protein
MSVTQPAESHNPARQASGKREIFSADVRLSLAEILVKVHLIPLDLACYHVSRMSDEEVEFEFEAYRRMGAAE